MVIRKHAHGDQQEMVSARGETSEKGFYDPFGLSPPFHAASPLGPSLAFSPENRTLHGGPFSMSREENLSAPPRFPEQSSPMSGMQTWNSQENQHGALGGASRRSQPLTRRDQPLFGSGVLAGQYHLQATTQDPQMTSSNLDPSVSLPSPSVFPVNSLPTQFASAPPYTPHNSFPGQYMMSSHSSPPFRNQQSQSYMYPGYHPHPSESGQYPPNLPGFFAIPRQHPQSYFPQQLTVEGGPPSYQPASRTSMPGPQHATGNPGSPQTGAFGGQQYPPPLYNSSGHFGFTQQPYQPSVYQWYYLPDSSPPMFNKGVAMPLQNYPVNYLQQPQLPPNNETHSTQSFERPPSPRPKHPGHSGAPPNARNHPLSPTQQPEQPSSPKSPALDVHEVNHKSATSASTSHAHERHLVRRHYHPNPPPNRSEWVMWLGNVPSDATHHELWRFLKQPVSTNPVKVEDDGVLSIFLISRSSCAFVNYQSEEHLNRAIARFNGRQLRPHDRRCPRLVCRARRKEDDLRAGVGAQRGMGLHTQHVKKVQEKNDESTDDKSLSTHGYRSDPCRPRESAGLPFVPSTSSDDETAKSHLGYIESPKTATRSSSSYASTSSSFLSRHFPKRFFILKSLTQYDLDLSVKRGVWATQKHNEAILDQAYRTSKEVILIFGVNKSGEFYGYARMTSRILRSDYSISRAQACETPKADEDPARTIPQMYTSPTESGMVEDYSLPVVLSPGQGSIPSDSEGQLNTASSKERPSAPPAFHQQPQDDVTPGVPLQSSFGGGNEGWPVSSGVSTETSPGPSWSTDFGRHPAGRPVARSKGGSAADSGNHGTPLQTVREEMHTGGNAEEESLSVSSMEIHDQSEVQPNAGRGSGWGETFNVEWLSTERVPFHRTRHLRNPWNHDREIKVSRDGTELEPGVGQELLDQWGVLASEAPEGEYGRIPRSGKRSAKLAATLAASGESKGIMEAPS